MDELHELYQEVIIDHSHHPRNFRAIADANRVQEGFNPLCGDKITLYVKEKDGVIVDAAFEGQGCAIFTASASLLTDAVKGKTVAEVMQLFEDFHHLVTSGDTTKMPESGGKLKTLAGVAEFPIRVKCAILPWHTLKAALEEERPSKEAVSTE